MFSRAKSADAKVVDVGQWSLPIPDIRGLNPVNGKFYLLSTTVLNLYWRDEMKGKRCRDRPTFKKKLLL